MDTSTSVVGHSRIGTTNIAASPVIATAGGIYSTSGKTHCSIVYDDLMSGRTSQLTVDDVGALGRVLLFLAGLPPIKNRNEATKALLRAYREIERMSCDELRRALRILRNPDFPYAD